MNQNTPKHEAGMRAELDRHLDGGNPGNYRFTIAQAWKDPITGICWVTDLEGPTFRADEVTMKDTGTRWCYFIPAAQDPDKHGGFVPSKVIENQPGHYPLLGRGQCATPWIWGQTLDDAEAICTEFNVGLGLSETDVMEIVGSSMRTGGL